VSHYGHKYLLGVFKVNLTYFRSEYPDSCVMSIRLRNSCGTSVGEATASYPESYLFDLIVYSSKVESKSCCGNGLLSIPSA